MQTDYQTLISLGKCYECVGAVGTAQLLKLGLLVQISNAVNPMAATDYQSLITSTDCYGCASNASISTLLELGLLQIIAQGIGSGGGSSVLEGSGSPVGVVTPTSIGQLYSDSTGTGLWQSTGLTNNSWTQLV